MKAPGSHECHQKHFGNLLLEKGFLLYFLCKCFSFTKELNKKGFFALTEVPIFSQFSS